MAYVTDLHKPPEIEFVRVGFSILDLLSHKHSASRAIFRWNRSVLRDIRGESVLKILTVVVVLLMLQGCAAMVVGATVGVITTVAVEAVKVPFKVTGAVIDVVTDDEDEDKDKDEDKDD